MLSFEEISYLYVFFHSIGTSLSVLFVFSLKFNVRKLLFICFRPFLRIYIWMSLLLSLLRYCFSLCIQVDGWFNMMKHFLIFRSFHWCTFLCTEVFLRCLIKLNKIAEFFFFFKTIIIDCFRLVWRMSLLWKFECFFE